MKNVGQQMHIKSRIFKLPSILFRVQPFTVQTHSSVFRWPAKRRSLTSVTYQRLANIKTLNIALTNLREQSLYFSVP